jgi:hypothetical protein
MDHNTNHFHQCSHDLIIGVHVSFMQVYKSSVLECQSGKKKTCRFRDLRCFKSPKQCHQLRQYESDS